MFPGHLKLLVLKILTKQELSGYAIIKQIKLETGFWKPSPGSIFPLLQKLEDEGLISHAEEKRRNRYAITAKGRQHVKLFMQKKHELLERMGEMLRLHQAIAYDKHDANFFLMIMEQLKKGEIPFKELQPEVGMVRGSIFKLYAGNKVIGNEKQIKAVLREAVRKLRRFNGKGNHQA
ncbi:PadR family transcriptional regulator [Candidatus Woesearchaeota archaeon]|nr:PadR family transcriptional regulator [Candidatus Woesearchaeota archaeon]